MLHRIARHNRPGFEPFDSDCLGAESLEAFSIAFGAAERNAVLGLRHGGTPFFLRGASEAGRAEHPRPQPQRPSDTLRQSAPENPFFRARNICFVHEDPSLGAVCA